MLDYQKFSDRINELGLTQQEVANKADIDASTLTHWKNQKYEPKISKLIKIADVLGVSLEYFLKEG